MKDWQSVLPGFAPLPKGSNSIFKQIGPLLIIFGFEKNSDITTYSLCFSVTNLMKPINHTVDNFGVNWLDVNRDILRKNMVHFEPLKLLIKITNYFLNKQLKI